MLNLGPALPTRALLGYWNYQIGITAEGSNITSWQEASGTGLTLTQSPTPSRRPTLTTAGVDFLDQFLYLDYGGPISRLHLLMPLRINPSMGSAYGHLYSSLDPVERPVIQVGATGQYAYLTGPNGSADKFINGFNLTDRLHLVETAFDMAQPAASEVQVWIDSLAGTGQTVFSDNPPGNLGGRATLGAYAGASPDGQFYTRFVTPGLLIYGDALSAAEQMQARAFLTSTFNLT